MRRIIFANLHPLYYLLEDAYLQEHMNVDKKSKN